MRRSVKAAGRAFASPDGRWTLVSTSLTATVAFGIVFLSLAASPPSSAQPFEPRREQAALPYNLLARLTGISSIRGISAEDAGHIRQASLIAGDPAAAFGRIGSSESLDGQLAAEQNNAGPATRALTVENGDTLLGMLTEAGANSMDAAAVIDALQPIFAPRNVRAGQVFEATFGPSEATEPPLPDEAPAAPVTADAPSPVRLLALSFAPAVDRQISVHLMSNGSYSAEDVQKTLQARYQHAGTTIDSSLYLAAMQAGIPASVVVEMIRMFSYDVDFQRDVHPGDKFEVLYNHYYTPEGQPAKAGEILSAVMTLSGHKHVLYRYATPDSVEYFDENGQSAKSMLMKTPVDGARISSGYGARLHPILGYTRMHRGVDFAVPKGTPVMAAGSGTVAFAGVQSGYGNIVIINHGNGYSTAYGHLSRFGTGIRVGTRVQQGQVVALSGMTGMATGPHLHYEIRVNNAQVNPLTVKIANGRKLSGPEMKGFAAERARIEGMIASMPMTSKVAVASGLRETSEQ